MYYFRPDGRASVAFNFLNVLFLTRINRVHVPHAATNIGNELFLNGVDVSHL
jgi:hypothetical protein